MATITTAIKVQDAMTPAFHSMNNALNIVLNSFENLQDSTHKVIDTASIQTAREELTNANATIIQVEEKLKRANNESSKMPQNFINANNSANNLIQTLMGLSIIQRGISMITGQVSSAISRIDTLNNYPKVMANLGISSDQANASMQMLSDGLKGLPTKLNDAVGSVQRFTSANGNVGASTKMFLALNNAILAGGAEMVTQQSALEQLSQSYAKGKPDMTEWRSAMSAMPAQLGQVATAMNFKSADALGEALRNGKVSMNEFMNTLIELNEKGANGFPSLAEQAKNATGGLRTSIENMKTSITRGIANMITSINEGLEKAEFGSIQDIVNNIGYSFENLLNNIGNFGGGIIELLSPVFNIIQQIGQFISDNWSIITPIILGIIGAFVTFNLIMLVYNTIMGISSFITGIVVAAKKLHTGATIAETAAQVGLNSALLACPLVWIIFLIIAIIAAIYAIIAAINKVTGSSISATGFILAMLMNAVAIIWNLFLGILDLVLGIINVLVNRWVKFANFFANLFNDPIGAIIHLFGDMADGILGILESIAKAIDKVFGSNLAGSVQGWRNGLDGMIEKATNKYGNGKYEEVMEELDLSSESLGLKRWDYKDASIFGYKLGQGIDNKVSDIFSKVKNPKETGNYNPTLDKLNNIVDNTGNTAGNTGKISDTLDATEEDLQYLRDIAERETINRFTTAEIKVDFTSNNNINSEMDIDGIVDSLGQKLEERLEVVAEGVYI